MKKYVVKQEDEADCGACCLLSVIKYYHGYVPLEVIKVDTLSNKDGTTFYNLKEAAIKYGFEVKGLKEQNLLKTNMPYIAQTLINNLYHFVVVYAVDSLVTVMDPSFGIKKYSLSDFMNIYTGYLLCLNPVNKIIKYEKKSYFYENLKRELIGHKLVLILLLLTSLFLILVSFLSTFMLKRIIDAYSSKLISIALILIIIKVLISYLKNIMVAHLNKKINNELIFNYFKHLFNLPFKYLQLKKKGDLINRVNDLNNIKDYFSKVLIDTIIYFMFLISSLIIMFNLNKNLSISLSIFTLIYVIISYFLNKKIYYSLIKVIDSETLLMDHIVEYLNNIWTIKILNKVNYFISKLKTNINYNNQNYFNLEKKYNLNELIINIYNEVILLIIIALGLKYRYSITSLFIYLFIFDYFNQSIKYFIGLIPNLMYFKGAYERISNLYRIKEIETKNGLKYHEGDIIASNLTYQINLKEIFNNLSFEIKRGNKVLLIGDNGSGKTTLLNILFLNITDYKGIIKIGNINIKDLDQDYFNNISYVSQTDDLFNDTILNNIILDYSFNPDKLEIINKMLYLDEIYKTKYNGLNSLIKDNLSGGEKQRIILARALYSDFDILMLDEALSEISSNLRIKIIQNINTYYKDKTIIYVSHNNEEYEYDQIINLTVRKDILC